MSEDGYPFLLRAQIKTLANCQRDSFNTTTNFNIR
jgi:hypothetical protein